MTDSAIAPAGPGKLIAFEGIDGSGISTQISLVKQWLSAQGYNVFFSQWESSEMVKEATKRGKKLMLFTPTTFSLVYATDFADRYETQILPMIKAGFIVLCDRYMYTSFARDAVRGCDPQWLRELYSFAKAPDVTFYLDLPLHMALDRLTECRQLPTYFDAGMDLGLSQDLVESFRIYQGRLNEEYLKMSITHGFTVVDASQDIHRLQQTLRRHLEERLSLDLTR